MPSAIWAISGFLGLPSDWDLLQSHRVEAVDWQAFSLGSLPDWGAHFNQWAYRQGKGPSVLIGYSLGGRLALHALLNQPDLWKGAVIISAHPGLADAGERAKRLAQDQQWADRFENEEWQSLMDVWNSQDIFSHDPIVFERKEKDYQRPRLMQALLHGSLGSQVDLRQQISELQIPILWITGSKDQRYSSIARGLSFKHPLSQAVQVEGAGHRVPWAQPAAFTTLLQDFLSHFALTFPASCCASKRL